MFSLKNMFRSEKNYIDGVMVGIAAIPFIFVNQIVCTVATECRESAFTRQVVHTCPTNRKEYLERANEKKCENISNSCDSFEYHCVLDTHLSFLQDVCAPVRVIIGGKCAEWNVGGQSIQSSKNERGSCSKFESSSCPLVYLSTYLYKYPGCYSLIQRKSSVETTTEPIKATTVGKGVPKPESFPIWIIPLIAVVIVISVLIVGVIAFKKRENVTCIACVLREHHWREIICGNAHLLHQNEVNLQQMETGNSTEVNGDVRLLIKDDVQRNGKIELPSPETQKVDVYKNFLGKEYHDKIIKKQGRQRYNSESSTSESEKINKYEECLKLYEGASSL